MEVLYHAGAEAELARLAPAERAAMQTALENLEALGARLPFPHQSAVKGARGLRELRPRAGRSRWRALYRQVGDSMVILAIGPEAEIDSRGFDRTVGRATQRLAEIGRPQEKPKKKGAKR